MNDDTTRLRSLIEAAAGGDYHPDTLLSLADMLALRLTTLSPLRIAEIEEELGRSPFLLPESLRDAADPLTRRLSAEQLAASADGCACSGEAPPEPTPAQEDEVAERLARRALAPVLHLLDLIVAPGATCLPAETPLSPTLRS